MANAETYQAERAHDLGFKNESGELEVGVGKRYSREDLEAFKDETFEAPLFEAGTLAFDHEWAKVTIDRTLTGWSSLPTEKLKTKKGEFRKFKAGSPNAREQHRRMNDGANIKIFENVHMVFEGRIPASWRDPDAIVETYRSAKAADVLLTPDLIRFGLVHPVTEVRTALCENQELTAQQKMIVGYMGIDSKDPAVNMINRMGPAGGSPFFMIAMANEFDGYQIPRN